MTAKVQPGQTVLDVALQYFGTPEAAFRVADALGVCITDPLRVGDGFEFASGEIADRHVADRYAAAGIVPATEPEDGYDGKPKSKKA